MKKTFGIYRFLAVVLSALLLISCSTKKNKWNRRAWHNMTSHYNVWWNGNQSMKEGEEALRTSVVDDYTKVLPVFNYGTKENAMAQNAQFDRTIEKSAICIQKHSMRFNGKEYVRWIDDAFIDMAKAHFYKQDFIPARRTFDYTAMNYPTSKDHYTATLWLAKTYIATKQYEKAEGLLQSLIVTNASDEKLPKYVERNLDLVLADFYISTGRNSEAVKYLRSAVITAKGKYDKSRAMFILGQIYAEKNENDKAIEQFENVIKKHPDYIMTFEARMNIARCSATNDTTEVMKMLRKMLKDSKNIQYQDRIYYAMADVMLKDGDKDGAIRYLRSSVAKSTTNTIQKIKSSLEVANMLFDDTQYVLSQAYFDTAVMSMDRTYPGYDSILNLSVMLTDLVANLTTYQLQDSLLRLSEMDTVQLYAVIDKVIDDYKAEQERLEEERATKEQIELLGGTMDPNASRPVTGDENGTWYFYNTATKTRGMTEFQRKWGRRILEDFWFITNKQSMMPEEEPITEEELAQMTDEEREAYMKEHGMNEQSADTTRYTELDRGFYLRQIPFSQEAKDDANKQIATALNNIGFIYYSDLKDYEHSIEAYTELSDRYPDNENEVSAWFYLYRMHNSRNENADADNYKNRVLTKYPDSNQAKIILDPEHFLKEAQKGAEAEQLYVKTFDAYKNGQYQRVRMNVEKARTLYSNDTMLMPRFEFLDAISLGYIEVVDSMAYALYRLVQNYPESSIKPYALEVLLKANDMYSLGLNIESARPKTDTVVEKESPYTFNRDEAHYILVICNTKNVRINPLKVRLGDFNKNNFRMLQLTVKNLMLNKEQAMLTIDKFENLEQAQDYHKALFINDYVFGGINAEDYQIIEVSISNYPIFYQEKNIEEYLEWWSKNNK